MELSQKKHPSDFFFIIWAGGGVLIAYFFVYVLRKSFTASTFEGYELFGVDYKVIISISQIAGYLLSKFCGIKIVSELKRSQRLPAIVISAVCAELSLVLFGLIPYPFNFFCLFLNGLSLGSMWGFLFAYIEGRRLTDILASFLGVSMVVSSGAAKSLGLFVLDMNVNPFWMPALIGAVAMPLLIGVACLLNRLPEPSSDDKIQKTERIPLDGKQRLALLKQYGMLLVPLLTVNILYTVLRDIKEDFLVDILEHTSIKLTSFLFMQMDSLVTIILLIVFGMMIRVKDNKKSLSILLSLMMLGSLLVLSTSLCFDLLSSTPVIWLFLQSMGIYTAYLAFQTIFFDRFIAYFRIGGNVGFFIYMADFLGYLFSCVFLVSRSLLKFSINWLEYYNVLSVCISSVCIIAILTASMMIHYKQKDVRLKKEIELC